MTKQNSGSDKISLHPRNKHRERYDFPKLILACPELKPFIINPKSNEDSIDFANPDAVKALNKALLAHFYQIKFWDIPQNYLCPAIPGRADYIHYVADLLAESNGGIIPKGLNIKCLDVGVGANCVYPIIGRAEYGWGFVGSDIDPLAIRSATNIVNFNPTLKGSVSCRLQKYENVFFDEIMKPKELFDVTICNPPFHASAEEAVIANVRKVGHLTQKKITTPALNFGGQSKELYCEGGEAQFIWEMINESATIPDFCFWFTTLVSKKENLAGIHKTLAKAKALETKVIEMKQGQKSSRIVAWTFLTPEEQAAWRARRWKA